MKGYAELDDANLNYPLVTSYSSASAGFSLEAWVSLDDLLGNYTILTADNWSFSVGSGGFVLFKTGTLAFLSPLSYFPPSRSLLGDFVSDSILPYSTIASASWTHFAFTLAPNGTKGLIPRKPK
jgi:hypothetical protein